MRFDRSLKSRQISFPRAPFTAAWVILLVLITLPSSGYWLPWATEQDKIKKSLNDIWKGLIDEDLRLLKGYLIGAGVETFLKQEKEEIRSKEVKSYTIRIRQVSLSGQNADAGFVEFEKVATLKNGTEVIVPGLTMVRKIGGVWRLVTGVRARDHTLRAKRGDVSNQDDGRSSSKAEDPAELMLPSGRSLESVAVPHE
jgi:hypothetical protein